MNTRFSRFPGANDSSQRIAVRPPDDIIPMAEPDEIIRQSCCCPASPVVRVLLPPTPQRPHYTDLLLCGHHLRASRQGLDACGAIIIELPHVPDDIADAFLERIPEQRQG